MWEFLVSFKQDSPSPSSSWLPWWPRPTSPQPRSCQSARQTPVHLFKNSIMRPLLLKSILLSGRVANDLLGRRRGRLWASFLCLVLKKNGHFTFKADRNRGGEEVGVVSPIFGHGRKQMKFWPWQKTGVFFWFETQFVVLDSFLAILDPLSSLLDKFY